MGMLRRFAVAAVPLLIVGAFLAPGATMARETPTAVSGRFNGSQENACIHVSVFFYLTDCTYTRSHPKVGDNELPWTGPTVNPVYYARGSEHAVPGYVPMPGDDRIEPTMEGTLVIDDRGTADPADDRVAGTLVVGPAARSVVANVNELAGGPAGRPPRAVISWSSMTHTLGPTPVSTATRTADGGVVYVIASKGFPERLYLKADPSDCYPSAKAPKTTDGQNAEHVWAAPGTVGPTRDAVMDGNVGAQTTAVMADYTCTDNRGGITCPNHNVVWKNGPEPAPGQRNLGEAPGFDNLLLRITVDAKGRIDQVEGFWTQEYDIEAGPAEFKVPEGHDNSWQGGYFELRGAAAR